MIGQSFTYKTFPRDRLVYACQSSSKADVFQKIVKDYLKVDRDMLVTRLLGHGITDAERIVTEVDHQIKERDNILRSLVL